MKRDKALFAAMAGFANAAKRQLDAAARAIGIDIDLSAAHGARDLNPQPDEVATLKLLLAIAGLQALAATVAALLLNVLVLR